MSWAPDPDALRGRVAVVAGATRGAGRGIAAALGEAGATVYCTGRSSRVTPLRSDYDRPETIEETAELVTSLGRRWHRGRRRPPRSRAGGGVGGAGARRAGSTRRAGERHLGRRAPEGRTERVGHADLGARPRRRPAHPAPGDRHAPDHVAPLPAAVGRAAGWSRGRGHRRHHRLQRRRVPHLGVLRPRQGEREPARVLTGSRVGARRRHRGRDHARLPALRDDARGVRGDARRTGASSPVRPTSWCPSRRATSGARSPRRRPTTNGRGGTSGR